MLVLQQNQQETFFKGTPFSVGFNATPKGKGCFSKVPSLVLVLKQNQKDTFFFEGTPFCVGFKATPKGHVFFWYPL